MICNDCTGICKFYCHTITTTTVVKLNKWRRKLIEIGREYTGTRSIQFDRNLDTLTKFKKAIRKEQSNNTKRIVKHFYYRPRKLNIILTQLRNYFEYYISYIVVVSLIGGGNRSARRKPPSVASY
jgi:hypothetical protein